MNQLTLVVLATVASKQMGQAEALIFMEQVGERVREESKEAYALSQIEASHHLLRKQEVQKAKEKLQASSQLLDELSGIEPLVHSAFYRVQADCDKVMGLYGSYYKNALMYLACVDWKEMSSEEQLERAHDLCIAALLGDQVYNFGELLLHPILQCLQGTRFQWLSTLVSSFNQGDLRAFQGDAQHWQSHPVLNSHAQQLSQKIILMALVEMVWTKTQRILTFSEIAAQTLVRAEEVEFLVMKALSLQLIKGRIDECEKCVVVEWVQPRVLQIQQIQAVKENVARWREKTMVALQRIEKQSALIVSE